METCHQKFCIYYMASCRGSGRKRLHYTTRDRPEPTADEQERSWQVMETVKTFGTGLCCLLVSQSEIPILDARKYDAVRNQS